MFHLFPRPCAGCQGTASPGGFCALCAEAAYPLDASSASCPVCALPRARNTLCARCTAAPPPFEVVRACWEYDGAVADSLRRVKYGGDLAALRSLCLASRPWFADVLQKAPPGSLLVPLPSHPGELRARGFHVPGYCLRHLGTQSLPITRALEKVRATEKQASLSEEARSRNVRGAFRYQGKAPPQGATALLFDDVMTTGATAREATRALLNAGFAAVEILVLARAARDN